MTKVDGRHDCHLCEGMGRVRFCTGKWTYTAPCPDCDTAAFDAAEIDGDHFTIGPAS